MTFFAAIMLWNSMTADAALNKWIEAVMALFASGATGWCLAKLYARPSSLTER